MFSTVNVSLPFKVRNNGTMYLHVFLVPPGQDPFVSQYTVHKYTAITTYSLPKSEVFSLMGDTAKVRTTLKLTICVSSYMCRISSYVYMGKTEAVELVFHNFRTK